MACREIASIIAALHDDRSLPRGQRLHHHLRLIPPARPRPCLSGDAEQDRSAIGQQLRTVHLLALASLNDQFWRAAIRRYARDPCALTEENRIVASPARAEGDGRRAQDHT